MNLPADFAARLSAAFAEFVWRLLEPRASLSAYAASEPIRVLAHNLSYWLPHAHRIIEEDVRDFGRVDFDEDTTPEVFEQIRLEANLPPGLRIARPPFGGPIWWDDESARAFAERMIESADEHGQLRAIIDSVRSGRIADDFSDRWSFEKADFERAIYKKRSKWRVTFVELDETVPVVGSSTHIENDLFWEDFMALLDAKERRVVICLRQGTTKAVEIARELGYANHSPISKSLARVRKKLQQYLA